MSDENKILAYHVSVVIPTLGGPSLKGTIEQINRGTLVPKEILVVIPDAFADRVVEYSFDNLTIVKTSFGGQVAQRAYGFSIVKHPFVLQVDDDLQLDVDCLEKLATFMGTRKDISVGPSLLDNITRKLSSYMSKPQSTSSSMYRLMFRIVNGKKGYQAGRISKAGVNMGFSTDATAPYEVDWLPGGCTLHARENLVTYNYYPYKGKAFAEDLFQSAILRKKGVKLYHCPEAKVRLDNTSSKGNGFKSLVKIFVFYSRIMMRFAKFTGSNRIRLFFFLILHHVLLISRKIKE